MRFYKLKKYLKKKKSIFRLKRKGKFVCFPDINICERINKSEKSRNNDLHDNCRGYVAPHRVWQRLPWQIFDVMKHVSIGKKALLYWKSFSVLRAPLSPFFISGSHHPLTRSMSRGVRLPQLLGRWFCGFIPTHFPPIISENNNFNGFGHPIAYNLLAYARTIYKNIFI